MPNSESNLPLFVDLDGTLIKTDVTFESLLLLIKKNLFFIAVIPLWLLKGRANLKYQLAKRVDLPHENLPYNQQFLSYLKQEKANGRTMTLISASNQQVVSKLNEHLKLFDTAIGSDKTKNLKSVNKLKHIEKLNSGASFAYAGNSKADLPIWLKAGKVYMVNCGESLALKMPEKADVITRFDMPGSTVKNFWQAMRPHQWLKNCLVFLPLILSHQLHRMDLMLMAVIGFVSFCLCASSVYLVNDMLDLNSDRQHQSKRKRPFAAGELALSYGLMGAPLLLLASFLVALLLPLEFLIILLLYWLLTTLYSLYLKRLFLVDVLALASLYTVRIFAGSAAISVVTTFWLLAFSFFLFLGLAIVKRYTEFSNLQLVGRTLVEGRAYSTANLRMLSIWGGLSGLLSILVFTFYINAAETTQLYSSPGRLWLICPLLLLLLARIWSFAFAGDLDEDPVLFAITDRWSQLITLCCGLLIWIAI
jgi:4-hydroxybenzoate polyprenyltransferase